MYDLKQQLNNSENRVKYRYLLLDMLGATSELCPLYIASLVDNLPSNDIAVVKRPELLHDLSSCPHLICLGKPNQDIDDSLFAASLWQVEEDFLTTKQYMCAWIVSEQHIDELAESLYDIGIKLGSLLSMQFIPFYEPLRIQLLQESNLANPNWVGSLFSVHTKYYYFDLQQTVREIKADENNRFPQLFLDHKISFFQKESVRLFQLYVLWYELKEKQGQKIDANELITMMTYYLDASLLGLTHVEDRAIFVLFSMQYGDLLQSSSVKKIIEDVALYSPGKLSERFRDIDTTFSQLVNESL